MNVFRKISFLLSDLPFVSIDNQVVGQVRNQEIPPNVYQTWEINKFGKRHADSIMSFRRRNPDLNFWLFDKSSRDTYMREQWRERLISEIYFRSQFGALRADIFRYCIIYDLGGYYFDISKGLDSSITSLHRPESIGLLTFEQNKFIGPEGPSNLRFNEHLVVQWGFGFVAKSNLLMQHIERIEQNYGNFLGKIFRHPKSAILEFSGPIAFTKTIHEFAKLDKLENICQAGIDFCGHGIFALPGSESRYLVSRGYGAVKNKPILL